MKVLNVGGPIMLPWGTQQESQHATTSEIYQSVELNALLRRTEFSILCTCNDSHHILCTTVSM